MCTHLKTKSGACRECMPWMFPSEERQAAYEQWFRDYRAYQGPTAPCYIRACEEEATESGRCVRHEVMFQQRLTA